MLGWWCLGWTGVFPFGCQVPVDIRMGRDETDGWTVLVDEAEEVVELAEVAEVVEVVRERGVVGWNAGCIAPTGPAGLSGGTGPGWAEGKGRASDMVVVRSGHGLERRVGVWGVVGLPGGVRSDVNGPVPIKVDCPERENRVTDREKDGEGRRTDGRNGPAGRSRALGKEEAGWHVEVQVT